MMQTRVPHWKEVWTLAYGLPSFCVHTLVKTHTCYFPLKPHKYIILFKNLGCPDIKCLVFSLSTEICKGLKCNSGSLTQPKYLHVDFFVIFWNCCLCLIKRRGCYLSLIICGCVWFCIGGFYVFYEHTAAVKQCCSNYFLWKMRVLVREGFISKV